MMYLPSGDTATEWIGSIDINQNLHKKGRVTFMSILEVMDLLLVEEIKHFYRVVI
jgi:hypothetical protein